MYTLYIYMYIFMYIYVYMLIDFLLTSHWIQTPDIWSQGAAMAVLPTRAPAMRQTSGARYRGTSAPQGISI